MIHGLKTLAGATLLAVAVGAAYGHDTKPRTTFDKLDKDNDGYISKLEAAASPRLLKRFDAADRDNDGRISRVEYGVAPRAAKRDAKPAKVSDRKVRDRDPGFNVLDKNNDGFVTRAEATGNGYLLRRFDAADKNNDGKLNRAEYLAAMTKKDVSTAKRKVENATAGASSKP